MRDVRTVTVQGQTFRTRSKDPSRALRQRQRQAANRAQSLCINTWPTGEPHGPLFKGSRCRACWEAKKRGETRLIVSSALGVSGSRG